MIYTNFLCCLLRKRDIISKLLAEFFISTIFKKIHLHFDIYIELAFRIHLFMFDPGTIYKEKTKNMQRKYSNIYRCLNLWPCILTASKYDGASQKCNEMNE